MLEARDIALSWRGTPFVRDVSLSIGPGETVVLIGPNGAGKSSLIRALIGLDPVGQGRVAWEGRDVTHSPLHQRDGMSLAPEGRILAPGLTVRETLLLGAGRARKADRRAAMEAMFDRFPILGARQRQPAGTLSGGEAQMLSLARALMARPRLLMLDEPTLGLSPAAARAVFDMLAELRAEGIGMLLTDQDRTAALALADRAFSLDDGVLRPVAAFPDPKETPPCSDRPSPSLSASAAPRWPIVSWLKRPVSRLTATCGSTAR